MALTKELADKILKAPRDRYPEPIANFQHLQELTGMAAKHFDDDWRLALEALEAEGLTEFQNLVRTGIDRHLRDFVNMRVTQKGRTTDATA